MENSPSNGITPHAGWSWGAFMMNASFIIAIKRYQLLWWYLLMLIPFVNWIFFIVFMIYLGSKGHEFAAASSQFGNQSEYDGFMKAVDHAGRIMFYVALAFVVVGILFAIVGLSFAPWGHFPGAMSNYNYQ
ncbi:MAG TPA: hypothetical protein VMT99_01265 [Candidatus Paceibacterota bacterium]|nr:hypothetical protein [Candidatus Paceibacterota bacterium]